MRVHGTTLKLLVGRVVIAVIALNNFVGFSPTARVVRAQERAIIINADQPNVWTLEQAHYLLAQMHRRNLDLRAKNLEELDPNEIAGLRFDVLRTLVELGVAFDDANRVTNRMLSANKDFNARRREELIARRQQLRDESLSLTREIGSLQAAKATATTQEEKDRLDAEIAAKTAVRAEVDKEVDFTDKELGTLTAPSGEFQRTEAQVEFDPEKLAKSVFDDAFKNAAKTMIERFNQEPRLNASLMLENFLQMQYEIVAKQLALLRDEVGPGERLLFLELPQTVNVTHHEANNKWAQSWWRIAGYTRNKDKYNNSRNRAQVASRSRDASSNQNQEQELPDTTADKVRKIFRGMENPQQERRENKQVNKQENASGGEPEDPRGQKLSADGDEYINLQDRPKESTLRVWDTKDKSRALTISDRTVRAVELIPRQSSLNVNDMKLRVQSGAFTAVASFLFGFGTRLNVQRQREQFSQFVQQELYSSAFGKGSREFGWTFTPMPGTDHLLSGARTTYAVIVVPDEATALVLESNGCYFPRSAYQPNDFSDTLDKKRWGAENRTSRNCGESKAFLVSIPVGGSGRNNFYADRIYYQPVDKGGRIVVSVEGFNFSSQTGVLINGSPLTPAIGLAQPLIRDDSQTGARTADDLKGERVHGRIERIDSEQIVFSFEMPADFTGTPTITLVAPGKAIDLNRLTNLRINGVDKTNLAAATEMFKSDPDPAVKIDGIQVFRSAGGRTLTALVSGKGFDANHYAYLNGVSVLPGGFISSSLIRAEIPTPPDETVQLVLSTGNKTIKSMAVPNPAHLKITNVTVVSYEPAGRRSPVAVLIVKLEGAGFSEWLLPSNGKLTPLSSTEALLRIEDPALVTPLVLTDRRTGFEASTVITRKRPRE